MSKAKRFMRISDRVERFGSLKAAKALEPELDCETIVDTETDQMWVHWGGSSGPTWVKEKPKPARKRQVRFLEIFAHAPQEAGGNCGPCHGFNFYEGAGAEESLAACYERGKKRILAHVLEQTGGAGQVGLGGEPFIRIAYELRDREFDDSPSDFSLASCFSRGV